MSCVQTLQSKIDQNDLDSIDQMVPNTSMTINVTNTIKQLFQVSIIKQETAKFTISLESQQNPSNIGVTIIFYQIINNIIINLGTVQVTEMILQFQKDFNPGIYYICISSTTYRYTGTFRTEFTGFQIYALLKPIFYERTVYCSY